MSTGLGAILEFIESLNTWLAEWIWDLGEGKWDLLYDMTLAFACIFSLIMVAGMAYRMMANGERLDILKLGRPILFGLLIANWWSVTYSMYGLSTSLDNVFVPFVQTQADELERLREEREQALVGLRDEVRTAGNQREVQEEFVDHLEAEPDADQGGDGAKELYAEIDDGRILHMQDSANYRDGIHWDNVLIIEWIEELVCWVAEILWGAMLFFIFLGRNIGFGVLVIFGPIAFACSILPVWENEWSRWISRMVHLAFYGPVAYLAVAFSLVVMTYGLQADIEALDAGTDGLWNTAVYYQHNGPGAWQYVIGVLLGCTLLGMVPKIAKWIVPMGGAFFGGVSSFVKGATGAVVVSSVAVTARTAGTGYGATKGAREGKEAAEMRNEEKRDERLRHGSTEVELEDVGKVAAKAAVRGAYVTGKEWSAESQRIIQIASGQETEGMRSRRWNRRQEADERRRRIIKDKIEHLRELQRLSNTMDDIEAMMDPYRDKVTGNLNMEHYKDILKDLNDLEEKIKTWKKES